MNNSVEHQCVFDSENAYYDSPDFGMMLLCSCGRWSARLADGTWAMVPDEVLPRICRVGSAVIRALPTIRRVAFMLAVMAALVATWSLTRGMR